MVVVSTAFTAPVSDLESPTPYPNRSTSSQPLYTVDLENSTLPIDFETSDNSTRLISTTTSSTDIVNSTVSSPVSKIFLSNLTLSTVKPVLHSTQSLPDASISVDTVSDVSVTTASEAVGMTTEQQSTPFIDDTSGKYFHLFFQGVCLDKFNNSSSNESSQLTDQINQIFDRNLTLVSMTCANNTLHVEVYSQMDLMNVFKMANLTSSSLSIYQNENRYYYELTNVELSESQVTTTTQFDKNLRSSTATAMTDGYEQEHEKTTEYKNLLLWNRFSEVERILIIIGTVVCFTLIVLGIIFTCRMMSYRKHTKSFNLGKTSIHIEVGPQDYVLEKMERPKVVYNNDGTIMYANTGTLVPPVPAAPSPCLSQHLRYSLRKEKQRLHRSRLELTQDIDDFNFDNESTLSRLERKLMQKSLESEMKGIDNPIFVNDEDAAPSSGKKDKPPDYVETQSNDSGVDGSSLGSCLKKDNNS